MASDLPSLVDDRLLRAARRYEALAADEAAILWVMDASLRPTGLNAAWEAYTGQTHEQYGELGWLDAIHESDRHTCLHAIETHVRGERPFSVEISIRRRDGTFRRHVVRAMPVRDAHGVLVEWIGTALDVEDARRAAEGLRGAEQRLWQTHDAAGVGLWEWLPRTGELRWSPHMYRLLGLEPGAILPSLEAWISGIHPDDVVDTTREWLRAVQVRDAIAQEFRVLGRDGVERWISARASVSRDAAGEVDRVFGVNVDVTARRSMEEQMRAALAEHRDLRERLLALTDGAEAVLRAGPMADVRRAICDLTARVLPADAYAIWALDPATSTWRVVHSSGLGAAFVSQELPGPEVPFTAPLVADDLDIDLLAHRGAAYRLEGVRALISVPLPIHGVRRGTLVAYYRSPHRTTEAEVQVAVALGHLAAAAIGMAETNALQEQMRAEAERHSRRMAFLAEVSTLLGGLEYEAFFRKLAGLAVPFLADWCAIDVEREGRLHRVAVAHPDPAKLGLARDMHDRYPPHPDQPHGVPRVLRTGASELYSEITDEQIAAATPDPVQLEMLRQLHLRSAIIVPLSARGRTFGALTLVSSSERRFDAADLAFAEELGRRAATAMDNARLYEEAQRANRAKDDFLALLSHELRTPLHAIMGWTQVLLNPSAVAEARVRERGLEIIQRNARVQAELVDGLLDVARVVSGGLPLLKEPLGLAEAAAAVVEAVRPVAAARGLELVLIVEAQVRVLADAGRFQQIVNNLLSNAFKFTDAGGRVRVTVRRSAAGGEIEVTDTGRGIPPELLPRVFERFWQADSSTTRPHGGLGLGLWLVQELVRAHGGAVRAASPGAGEGSTFTVTLPLADGSGGSPPLRP